MNIATKPAKHSAPGPYLGFALQPVRLCYHLLTCPKGAQVSMEHADDVAIHAGEMLTLEQTKSALKHNALSDWSEDLWKTIANWIEGVESGETNAETTHFRLYVTPLHSGPWARAIHAASTVEEIAKLTAEVEVARNQLKKPPACAAHLARFLNATGEVRSNVLTRLTILSENDPLDALRLLVAPTVQPALVDLICEAAIGMAKERADRLMREGLPGLLDGDAFKRDFIAFVQKNNMPGYLTSFAPQPANGEVVTVLSARPTFIRQLELIQVSDDERVRAVSDYLRTSADKAIWAEAGLVFSGSFEDWDDNLVGRHGMFCGEVADLHAEKPAPVRGRLIYRHCAQLQAPLEGRSVPGHFVHGCYNALADVRRIGWHPDFAALLGAEDA